MAENLIQSIQSMDRMDVEARSSAVFQLFRSQEAADTANTSQTAQTSSTARANPATSVYRAEKVEKAEEKPAALLPVTTTTSDVYLKFNVDEANNITVYVIDRASKRVLRSIPPNDVNKLKAGDLLKLLA